MPTSCCSFIATDFIADFPEVLFQGVCVDANLTVVDRLSDRVHLNPALSEFRTQDLMDLLLHHYFPLHGLFKSIQSDCGPQFSSAALQSLLRLLKVESKLSFARHQQSNGHVENRNKLIKTCLSVNTALRKDWPNYLFDCRVCSQCTALRVPRGHSTF